MNLFAGIDPAGQGPAIQAAASAVAARLAPLRTPCSLCEARPDEDDYAWLRRWAEKLEPATACSWLTPVPDPQAHGMAFAERLRAIGCLLLFVADETARREAREGWLWSVVQECFRPETRRRGGLFAQGQPTRWHKEALEAAADWLGLRHVFGIEGTQNYYVTVYLQFGFTHGALAQLPYWLVGQSVSEAVHHLLETAQGARFPSASFQRLWCHLREFRRRNVTEDRLRRTIKDSPWVLPTWEDELVRQARAKPELADSSGASGQLAGARQFLDPPRLCWQPPADPRFTCALANLADLAAERYRIQVGSRTLATLLRRADETYDHPGAIELPLTRARYVVSLVDDPGPVVPSEGAPREGGIPTQAVDLWQPADDVNVYELPSGRRLPDAWRERLDGQRAYALVIADDLDVEPPPTAWHVAGGMRFVYLAPGWPADLKVTLEGEALWAPYVGRGQPPTGREPDWASGLAVYRVESGDIALGGSFCLALGGLPEGAEVAWVRVNGQAREFRQSGVTVVEGLIADAELAGAPVECTIGLRRGDERTRVRRSLQLDVVGAAAASEYGWDVLYANQEIQTAEAREQVWRVFLPLRRWQKEGCEPSLFEGATFTAHAPSTPRPLGALAGLGAALTVRQRPYNAREEVPLARCVTAPGVVSWVERAGRQAVCIQLRLEIEWSCDHQVAVWPVGGAPGLVPAGQVTRVSADRWQVEGVRAQPERLLLGVAYQGARLGCWWPDSLGEVWREPACDATCAAALIRWLQLPILDARHAAAFRTFAHAHPGETLAAWLLDRGLPAPLEFAPTGEAWLAAVREVFWEWQPDPVSADGLARGLSGPGEQHQLAILIRALRSDPLLLRRVLAAWSRGSLAGLAADGAGGLDCRAQALLDRAAAVMGVDQYFLRHVARRALQAHLVDGVDLDNLRAALGVAPFRDFLTLEILRAAIT